MNKKIYRTPLIEQTECLGMSNLCDVISPTGTPKTGNDSGSGQQPPTSNAPKRPMF